MCKGVFAIMYDLIYLIYLLESFRKVRSFT